MSKKIKSRLSIVLTAVFLICIIFSSSSFTFKANSKVAGTVYLKGMKIKANGKVSVPEGLMKKGYNDNEKGPYLVFFNGPIKDSMKNEAVKLGAELVEYLPDFAFLANMTSGTAEKLEELSYIEDVMIYHPGLKINPYFKEKSGGLKDLGEVKVRIITFNDKPSIDDEIAKAGGKKLGDGKNKVTANINSKELGKIADLNAVKYIELAPEYVLYNDVAKNYMGVNEAWNIGYEGAGQVVGVCDTGLDTGKNDSTMHQDFQGRINSIFALGRSTATDPHGHGTHVAGSVLGSGARSNGQYKGIAPKANLVFQSVLDSSGGLGGLPNDLNTLFAQSYNAGARIHTNSWGAALYGQYNTDAQQVDEYIWNNKDMTILFAAGNEGDGYLGTDYDSISSPGTAKNCITVGASENDRPNMPITRWGNVGDNVNEIAAFSSRGNCEDGRAKPDIVAPGTWVLSTKSSMAPESNFWSPFNSYYAYMGGTSMATPLTAGAVAVAREYMVKQWGHTPSPAMMKAAIINGGTDMGFGYPSRDQGWGRVNLNNSLISKEYKYEDQNYSLATGQKQTFNYSVESTKTPLKVSLVWTDFPGSPTASKALVNDIDLKITSPSGKIYYGNDFTSPYNSSFDRLNNVENINISVPEVGNYTVEVSAYNVPNGPQNFALFSSGDFGGGVPGDTEPPTTSITTPANGETVSNTVTINAAAADNTSVNRVEFYVDGTKVGTDTTSPYSYDWDSKSVANGSHTIQTKAFDGAGNVGNSSIITVTVQNESTISYKTDTFSGTISSKKANEHFINVTASGNITLNLKVGTGINMTLYDPSGVQVAAGTTTINYNAPVTGNYKVRITTTSKRAVPYTLDATYPIIN